MISLFSSNRYAPAFAVLGVALLSVLIAPTYLLSEVPLLTGLTNDHLFFVSNAYRVAGGQIPHIDFHDSFGALISYMPYWITNLYGTTLAHGLNLMIFTLGIIIAALVGLIGSYRLPAMAALALPVTVGLFSATNSTYELRNAYDVSGAAFFYNRFGAGFCVTAALMALPLCRGRQSKYRIWLEGLSLGAICSSLLFIKITYAGIFVTLLIFAYLVEKQSRRPVFIALLCATLCVATIYAFLPDMIENYIAAIIQVIKASEDKNARDILWENRFFHFVHLLPFGIFCALAAGTSSLKEFSKSATIFFCIFLLALSLSFYSHSNPTVARLMYVLPFILWAMLATRVYKTQSMFFGLVVLVYATLLNGHWLESIRFADTYFSDKADFVALGGENNRLYIRKHIPLPEYAIFGNSDKSDFQPYLTAHHALAKLYLPNEFYYLIRSGVKLLNSLPEAQQHPPPKVHTVNYIELFPYVMGWPTPSGSGLHAFYDLNRHLNKQFHPPPETAFPDIDIIMVPKLDIFQFDIKTYFDIYGDYIAKHYIMGPQNTLWQMLIRGQGDEVAVKELVAEMNKQAEYITRVRNSRVIE